MDIRKRFQIAQVMQEHYAGEEGLLLFTQQAMNFLGFDCTEQQADIARYMHSGPRLRMVQAARGEAKSTLAAIYAVWRLVQAPPTRILIVSGGARQAGEVAYLVIRLVTSWDILEYLRPDRNAGDRSSTEAFDVHWSLKGVDKSPSVACVGVTANLPGKRADLLIPDDVEQGANSETALLREKLLHSTKEFSAICTHGDILYLGTPQSKDSIYNTLPGRGFDVRVWPGRFPNAEERIRYGDTLAPYILQRMQLNPKLCTGYGLDGTRGASTDTGRYSEEDLIDKELDQGPEGFQLQYMLDTSLADAVRQQLKLSDLVVSNSDWEMLPEHVVHSSADKYLMDLPRDFPVQRARMFRAVPVECMYQPAPMRRMFIDPAGAGGDMLAWGISTALGPFIHVLNVQGVQGGFTEANMDILCARIVEFNVTDILCESNMGHGLFEINLRAELEKRNLGHVGVRGEYSTGQKEKRIINRLVGAMQRHRVVVHQGVFDGAAETLRGLPLGNRVDHSLWHQISSITTDRGSLKHDDLVEAFAGCVFLWNAVLAQDADKEAERRAEQEMQSFLSDPMGYNSGKPRGKLQGTRSRARSRYAT